MDAYQGFSVLQLVLLNFLIIRIIKALLTCSHGLLFFLNSCLFRRLFIEHVLFSFAFLVVPSVRVPSLMAHDSDNDVSVSLRQICNKGVKICQNATPKRPVSWWLKTQQWSLDWGLSFDATHPAATFKNVELGSQEGQILCKRPKVTFWKGLPLENNFQRRCSQYSQTCSRGSQLLVAQRKI